MTPDLQKKLTDLKARLSEIDALAGVMRILHWDQATQMPARGASARVRQLAAVSRVTHERRTDVELGRLLDALEPLADALQSEALPSEDRTGALIRVARRDYERATRVPNGFIAEMRQHQARAYEVWKVARPANDFAAVRPFLERTLELSRELAGFFEGWESVADPLIAFADYGMTARWIREQFADLKRRQLPLVKAVCDRPQSDDNVLLRRFPAEPQIEFGLDVIRRLGYDFERGRQDMTIHPFMTRIGGDDIRITTRVNENNLAEALFGTIHETGHALYELGIDSALDGTPLGHGTSTGVHESQSRLWENIVGRSLPFWQFFYPRLQATFPDQLEGVSLADFHKDINRVERSLIRTDADELTYNLHVMLRFELEIDLLEGRIEIVDLPETWKDRMEDLLGVRPSDDTDGVLQDVHWFAGVVGGEFQGYALGNIMSAQFYRAAVHARPEIEEQIAEGRFGTLLTWLQENVYCHGRSLAALELVETATGETLSIDPYIDYLTDKYAGLYGI